MKTFLRFIAALALAASVASAAPSLQASAVVDPQSSYKNPVSGGLALEDTYVRLGLQFSNPRRVSGNIDLVGRDEERGFVFGVGLVADDISAPVYFEDVSNSDTTTVNRPHDNGKHKGDRHERPGKGTTVSISEGSVYLSLGGLDLRLVPSLFIGIAAEYGMFVESRVLFDGGEVSNRVSVGLRF